MPKSIAIIMDGNRRWARQYNLPVQAGHKKGAEVLKRISEYAFSLGIRQLVAYTFSIENFKRSKQEVSNIMQILKSYLHDFSKNAPKNIKLKILGDKSLLSHELVHVIQEAEQKNINAQHTLFLAFAYGGRQDILQAAANFDINYQKGGATNEDVFKSLLWTNDMLEPDILVRTGGEKRLSNFLLWDLAYTELFFTDILWPDFTETDLDTILNEYKNRQRRFGI